MKTLVRLALSVAIAAALLYALARWGGVRWQDCWDAVRRLSVATFLLAMAIHVGIYLLRAQRFRILIGAPQRPGLFPTLWASSAHNMAAYVMPAKTGEATLVLYLKASCGVPAVQGVASLLVSRLLDVATMTGACAATAAYLVWTGRWTGSGWLALACSLGLALASSLGFLLAFQGPKLVRAAQALVLRILRPGPWRKKIEEFGARLMQALEVPARSERRQATLLSLGIWLGIFLFYTVLARGVGVPDHVGFIESVFGSGAAVLSNLLPINPFAGLGTQEAGWVLGFALVGVPKEASFPTGLAVHLIQLLDTVLLGVLGHFLMGLTRSQAAPPKHERRS